MQIVHIRKKSGGTRAIYVPSEDEKAALRAFLPRLQRILDDLAPRNVLHGFVPGRNAVTNAQCHIGYQVTTCFDLKDFFDTVTRDRVESVKLTFRDSAISQAEARYDLNQALDVAIVDGATRQGLPTSPVLANIAAVPMDRAILHAIDRTNAVYTRYADDLTISYNDPAITSEILILIPKVIADSGFVVNERKTRTMHASAGRRIITGVAVDGERVYPRRKAKRQLRAATHQNRGWHADGLREWCKVKQPHAWRLQQSVIDTQAQKAALNLPKGVFE